MDRIVEILEDLKRRKKAVSCDGKTGLLMYMEELGFSWKEGKTAGHKVFVHKALTEASSNQFTTHSIDCGHAPKRPMKFSYVVQTIRMVEKYQIELSGLMGARL
ncbi:hypothetical protein [Vibrio harveyi]|uniref:hypothetical protein n=1 Tax=Vibrio harveyi TaxID=669 RepID=UPI002ED4DE78|nr:hypothetical protein V1M48_18450 [Vibrio harveyi]